MKKQYMAIDQYGNTFHGLEYPRKDLMKKLGYSCARKMYIDSQDGESFHIGYIIGNHCLSVYEVTPMRKPA